MHLDGGPGDQCDRLGVPRTQRIDRCRGYPAVRDHARPDVEPGLDGLSGAVTGAVKRRGHYTKPLSMRLWAVATTASRAVLGVQSSIRFAFAALRSGLSSRPAASCFIS